MYCFIISQSECEIEQSLQLSDHTKDECSIDWEFISTDKGKRSSDPNNHLGCFRISVSFAYFVWVVFVLSVFTCLFFPLSLLLMCRLPVSDLLLSVSIHASIKYLACFLSYFEGWFSFMLSFASCLLIPLTINFPCVDNVLPFDFPALPHP